MSEEKKSRGPRIPRDNLDYVDLWKYFESRGADVKNTMFSVVTWIIGFAAAVLGFLVKEFIGFQADALVILYPLPLIVVSLVGMCIVVYADILIRDFGEHINRNFDRADRAREGDRTVDEIWGGEESVQKAKAGLPPICKRIRAVVWAFGGAFALIILVGVAVVVR